MHIIHTPDQNNLGTPQVVGFAFWLKVMYGYCSLVNKALKQAACRDAAHWFTKHRNKVHVGCHHKNQCDETTQHP